MTDTQDLTLEVAAAPKPISVISAGGLLALIGLLALAGVGLTRRASG